MWSTVKKFGLQHCDLPTMLWNVAVLLRPLTLNIDSRNKTPISMFTYVALMIVAVCYFFVYLISMFWFVFIRCHENGDLLSALIILSLGVSSEIGPVKLVYMFLKIDTIRQMVKDTLAIDETVVPGSRFANNLIVTLRNVKKRAMIFWLVIIGNGVVYIGKPIILPGRHFMEDRFVLFGLEPMLQTPNYQIAFLLMCAGVGFTCYLPANISALLIVFTGYIEAQMLALTDELNRLWDDAEEHYYKYRPTSSALEDNNTEENVKSKIMNKYIEEHLKIIIKSHGKNLRLLQQVDQVFSSAIGFEFFLLGIGLIVELLGGLENTWIEMPFAMMQVFMDCFTGQRLVDASVKFEKAVYECQWEKYDKKNMKIIHTMVLCSQKTMALSAGGIAVINFSCLMQVNRSIYSAYTTLRSTMK